MQLDARLAFAGDQHLTLAGCEGRALSEEGGSHHMATGVKRLNLVDERGKFGGGIHA
jgi:hypothetical protein